MNKDVLNKTIEEICEEYSDEGLMRLLPVLKDEYNRLAVVDELYTRDIFIPPALPPIPPVFH